MCDGCQVIKGAIQFFNLATDFEHQTLLPIFTQVATDKFLGRQMPFFSENP